MYKWLLLVKCQGHAQGLHFCVSVAPAAGKSSFCNGLLLVLMVFFLPICLLCHFFSSSESLTMASSWVGVSSMSDDLSLRLKCEPTERSWFITATWTTSTYTSVSCTSTLFIFNFTTVPRQREWYKVGIQTVLDTLANRLREWGAQGLWWVITCPHPLWNTDAIRTSRRTEELPGATVTTLTPYGFWRGEKKK